MTSHSESRLLYQKKPTCLKQNLNFLREIKARGGFRCLGCARIGWAMLCVRSGLSRGDKPFLLKIPRLFQAVLRLFECSAVRFYPGNKQSLETIAVSGLCFGVPRDSPFSALFARRGIPAVALLFCEFIAASSQMLCAQFGVKTADVLCCGRKASFAKDLPKAGTVCRRRYRFTQAFLLA